MSPDAMDEGVRLLLEAARSGRPLPSLPEASRPATAAEALVAQERLVKALGEEVAGWKVATDAEGVVMWGAILAPDCFASPAQIPSARMPLMGVEAEIAFRLDRDLPVRPEAYSREEIEAAVTAFPAIEIVDSRFASYTGTPMLDRLVDRMSNGGIVCGAPQAGWRALQLAEIPVTLDVDGTQAVNQVGGHARGDPLLPALEFIRAVQHRHPLRAGQFITTGTFTGLRTGKPGERYRVAFAGLGEAEVRFV